ncbi:DoxX family protein [Rhodococcus sp. NPDC003318]|uniref:DoxX family protein n=1 Tax=Rhodococcus sp. NPDC003318 TaxID=3364503 RepID=UPI00367E213F
MTDTTRPNSDPDGVARSATSPFDQPTERIPTTDDDLGLLPTEQIPTYATGSTSDRGPFASDVTPTEELRTADSYDRELASALAASTAAPAVVPPAPQAATPRGTLDLGLLVLRVAVGALMLAHGLQKLFGLWGGPGLDGFEMFLVDAGFQQARILAYAGAVGEVVGGVLLIVGLLTPLAAAGLLALVINAWCVRQAAAPGLQWFAPDGPELEALLAAMLVAIILAGPGRFSLEGRRKWATRPHVGSFLALVLGVAGGVCLWIFLNGVNPLV